MGIESLQALKPVAPKLPSSHYKTALCRPSFYLVRKNQSLASSFGPWKNQRKSPGLKQSCSASFNEFFGEEIEDLAGKVEAINDNVSGINEDSSMSFLPSKLEFLEPNLLGIQPDPPEWPEREEIVRVSIERRANRLEIPLSLRMIKRKQKWQEGNYNFSFCSAKKAFSHMVFMVRELQFHALQIRESLYSEDLQVVMSKVQVEMNASFVWLFQQVFSRTPTLMVYVMLLLANFTVHSMVGHTHIDIKASPLPTTYEENIPDETMLTKKPGSRVVIPREEVQNFNKVDDEVVIWNAIVEEASGMSMLEVLDPETIRQVVSSFKVELEPDNYEEYYRTDLVYQMAVAEDPYNSLLLSNYAQFLYLVSHDYDRAEECFKRAIMAEPNEAESLSHYADFLWQVRKDLWGAEERYQQALAAAPSSHYHASKYATFLWSTGGEETCFPLNNTSNDNYNKVV